MSCARDAAPQALHQPPTRQTFVEPKAEEEAKALGVLIPERAVELGMQRAGKLVRLSVYLGQRVAAGALLAALDKKELVADHAAAAAAMGSMGAQCRIAQAQAEMAKQVNLRRKALISNEHAGISKEEAERAESEHQIADARVAQCQEDLKQKRASVSELEALLAASELRAPFSGTIAARYLSEGATVSLGQHVLRIVSDSPPLLRFAVPERERLKVGQSVCAAIAQPARVEPGDHASTELTARVARISPEIDDAMGLLVVEALLDGPPNADITFGMQVDVAMHCAESGRRLEPSASLTHAAAPAATRKDKYRALP